MKPPATLDAVKFLQLLIGQCDGGTSDHAWAKCRRCLAIEHIEGRDALAVRLLKVAIAELAVVHSEQADGNQAATQSSGGNRGSAAP